MEKKKTTKTPEYTRRAIANYQSKFDRVNINLEKGLKDRLKALTGESLNACVNRLIKEEIERREQTPDNTK